MFYIWILPMEYQQALTSLRYEYGKDKNYVKTNMPFLIENLYLDLA